MKPYYEDYKKLPDTENLGHVTMSNVSSRLDYAAAVEHINDSKEYLITQARALAARAQVRGE